MMHTYSFEKLEVWQLGRDLNKRIYKLSQQLPSDEKFGAMAQIRRASLSVTCNLAEGSGRRSGKDQARFSEIAYSSLMEVLNLLIIFVDLEFLNQADLDVTRPLIENISRKVSALQSAQLKRYQEQTQTPKP